MLVEFLLLIFTVLVFVWRDRKPKLMPPGPWEIPFLGRAPDISRAHLAELNKKYGDIVAVRTGAVRTVYLFDYHTARDVLGRQELSNRPPYLEEFRMDHQETGGVLMSNGVQWVHDRRFMLRNLRNFGMGKTYLEDAINIEAQALVEHLLSLQGKPTKIPDAVKTVALNIIWQMVASTRYELESEEVRKLYDASKELVNASGAGVMILAWFPLIRYLPRFIIDKFSGVAVAEKFRAKLLEIVDEAVAKHEENYDPENLKDLIDEYLYEMKEADKSGEPHLFRRGALAQIVGDSFDAGADTVQYSLRWIIHLLARYPEQTREMQRQIDDVIPRGNPIVFSDKKNLPLIESFITEMLRHSAFASTGFERMVSQDIKVDGYVLPKGTVVNPVTFVTQKNSEMFEDPETFKHNRFLDADGSFKAPKQGILLFGTGKRTCPGETLAKAEVFLFTCALLQRLNIATPAGEEVNPEIYEFNFGLVLPEDQPLIYTARA